MKKSEIYRLAQLAVLRDGHTCLFDKLEILKTLFDAEDLETYREQKEKENENA